MTETYTEDRHHTFATLIAISRGAGTAAEFDYEVARAGRRHYATCFRNAAYELAKRNHPEMDWKELGAEAGRILDLFADEIQAFGEAAQQKRFTGWSTTGEKIRYAK
jgi:hypothetical protein